MTEDDFKDMSYFLTSLEHAKQNALESEWLYSFLDDFDIYGDLKAAIAHANREWDL